MATNATQRFLIRALDARAERRAPGQWQLAVTWRFENQADAAVYILLAAPVQFQLAAPLILDHTAHWPPRLVDVNADLGFSVFTLPAAQTTERALSYQLAMPAATKQVTIVGRFGYSYRAHDPAWASAKNWQQVVRWQQIVDAEACVVDF